MNVVDIKRFESMVYNSFNLHRDAKVIRIADINDDGFSTYFKDTYIHSYFKCHTYICMYGARNIEMSIRFSLKSRLSERFHRPEMSQIKAEIGLHTNVKLNFHKNVGCQ